MSRIALALPLELEDALLAELVRHGHEPVARCESGDDLARRFDTAAPDVAVVASDPRFLTERLLRTADAAGVSVIAIVRHPAERRLAAGLGLLDTVEADDGWPGVEHLLGRRVEPPAALPPAGDGRVITVWGPVGAPGRTSIAVNLAAEFALLGRRVVVGDVDTHGASVAPMLGILDEAPGFAAACRLAATDSLDDGELDRVADWFALRGADFRVLTGIGRPSRWPELSSERVSRVIDACRAWCEVTVLDTAASLENDEDFASDVSVPRRNAATVTALEQADHVLAIARADPVGMARFLRAHADLLEVVPPEKVTVVVNGVRASVIGAGPGRQIERTLARFGGITAPVLVPDDRPAFDAALAAGRVLSDVARRSPARQAIRALAAGPLAIRRGQPALVKAAGSDR